MPLATHGCVKETKKERREQRQFSAASIILDEEAQKTLVDYQLQWVFEGFRAVACIPFDFRSFLRALWGHEDLPKAAKVSNDLPDLDVLQRIKSLFAACQANVINRAAFLDLSSP